MTTPLDQTERAAFEAAFRTIRGIREDSVELHRWKDAEDVPPMQRGQYVLSTTRIALAAWQAAIASRAAPEGWQLVPIRPTDEMMGAVVSSMDEHLMGKDGAEAQYREDWAAMLRAAPTPPIAAKAAKETPQ